MEATILETALSQGIWAALAVFLLISMMKENEKADQRQSEREARYQTLLMELMAKFEILASIESLLSVPSFSFAQASNFSLFRTLLSFPHWLIRSPVNSDSSLFQSAHSCFKNICSCKKSKKTGTPSNNPVRPKSLDLHTFCIHVSAFVSVCFVCGIPDDALSYILLYDCQIQSCSLCNRNADRLFVNFRSITVLSIYQNFCSVKIFFYFISLPAPAVPAPVSAPVLLWTY